MIGAALAEGMLGPQLALDLLGQRLGPFNGSIGGKHDWGRIGGPCM